MSTFTSRSLEPTPMPPSGPSEPSSGGGANILHNGGSVMFDPVRHSTDNTPLRHHPTNGPPLPTLKFNDTGLHPHLSLRSQSDGIDLPRQGTQVATHSHDGVNNECVKSVASATELDSDRDATSQNPESLHDARRRHGDTPPQDTHTKRHTSLVYGARRHTQLPEVSLSTPVLHKITPESPNDEADNQSRPQLSMAPRNTLLQTLNTNSPFQEATASQVTAPDLISHEPRFRKRKAGVIDMEETLGAEDAMGKKKRSTKALALGHWEIASFGDVQEVKGVLMIGTVWKETYEPLIVMNREALHEIKARVVKKMGSKRWDQWMEEEGTDEQRRWDL